MHTLLVETWRPWHLKHCQKRWHCTIFTVGKAWHLGKATALTLSWRKSLYDIETSILTCRANQWTGFYMIGASVMKGLATTHKWVNTTLIHEKLRMAMYNKVNIKAVLHRCSYKEVFWKHAANLQENTHSEVQFQ